jgi:hypothetical protein
MYKGILTPGLFCYSHAEIVNMANNTIQTPVINISNDSDFELFEIRAIFNKAAATTGGIFIQLSLASGELFSNVAIDAKSFAAGEAGANVYGGYPIRLPVNTRIPANSTINVQVNNLTDNAIDFQIQLWGFKVEKAN